MQDTTDAATLPIVTMAGERIFVVALSLLLAGCASTPQTDSSRGTVAPIEVVRTADVAWEQLNPARGDQSPKAGTLWGDRKGVVPTGYLIRFEDGFCSPPHIHNVSYRGIVIRGLAHNDDPDSRTRDGGRTRTTRSMPFPAAK